MWYHYALRLICVNYSCVLFTLTYSIRAQKQLLSHANLLNSLHLISVCTSCIFGIKQMIWMIFNFLNNVTINLICILVLS